MRNIDAGVDERHAHAVAARPAVCRGDVHLDQVALQGGVGVVEGAALQFEVRKWLRRFDRSVTAQRRQDLVAFGRRRQFEHDAVHAEQFDRPGRDLAQPVLLRDSRTASSAAALARYGPGAR